MEFLDRVGWLTLLIFTQFVGALILIFVPGRQVDLHRWDASGISLVAFALSLIVTVNFDDDEAGFQLVQEEDWISFFGIQYEVGVDGISLVLILLTTLLTSTSILASIGPITTRVKEYMISFSCSRWACWACS